MINGGELELVVIGQLFEGVKVVLIQGDQVVIDIVGKKCFLCVGQYVIGVSFGGGLGKIVMMVDVQGYFVISGSINGVLVCFLVDIGVMMILFGVSDVCWMGLDFNWGLKGMSQIVNGQVLVSKI